VSVASLVDPRFYVIWAYLPVGLQKDLPRSRELLDVAPKGKLRHGIDMNPIHNTIWTEQFTLDLAQIFLRQSDRCASRFNTVITNAKNKFTLQTL
jgi:hypothetical protein